MPDAITIRTHLRPGSRFLRAAFVLYALALFTLTHWPRFTVDIPGVERPDLFVHLAAFGIWTLLLNLASFLGPPHTARTVLLTALVAAVYACIDEGLQAIPFLQRTAAWDDLAADLLGVASATAACLIPFAFRRPKAS